MTAYPLQRVARLCLLRVHGRRPARGREPSDPQAKRRTTVGWPHEGAEWAIVDAGGFVHVVERMKDIVIRGGTTINPHEVESILRDHPRVLDSCVVGRIRGRARVTRPVAR
jgi:acyl-CoA synthetase (AMP-forming)/AMP-acid ligase II